MRALGPSSGLGAGQAVGAQAETEHEGDEAEDAEEREVGAGIGQGGFAGGDGQKDGAGLGRGSSRGRGGGGVSSGEGDDGGLYVHALLEFSDVDGLACDGEGGSGGDSEFLDAGGEGEGDLIGRIDLVDLALGDGDLGDGLGVAGEGVGEFGSGFEAGGGEFLAFDRDGGSGGDSVVEELAVGGALDDDVSRGDVHDGGGGRLRDGRQGCAGGEGDREQRSGFEVMGWGVQFNLRRREGLGWA
jgi:hypothetical protein